MGAKIGSRITISAKLLVGVAVLSRRPMSDLPPNPLKSPILIVLLIAVVVAVLAAIGYIVTHW
jgi:hypothetical protein